MVAELRSFIEGELQVEPIMASHGYDDDFDIVDEYDSYAMRRSGPTQQTIHMTQQMTTKVAPHMMDELVSLLMKMQLMTGVISLSWRQRNVDQHWGIDLKVKQLFTNDC